MNYISFQKFLVNYNPLTLFLSEFGSTLITPILAQRYISTYGELSGKTYFGALAILLPLSSYYMADIRNYKNIGALLNPYAPAKGALGGSLIGDIIINFGYSGLIIAGIIGFLLIYISNSICAEKGNIFFKCLLIFLSYGIIWYTRGSTEEVILAIKRCLYILIIWWGYKNLIKSQQEKYTRVQGYVRNDGRK